MVYEHYIDEVFLCEDEADDYQGASFHYTETEGAILIARHTEPGWLKKWLDDGSPNPSIYVGQGLYELECKAESSFTPHERGCIRLFLESRASEHEVRNGHH